MGELKRRVAFIGREYFPKNASSIRAINLSNHLGSHKTEVHLLLPDLPQNRELFHQQGKGLKVVLTQHGFLEIVSKYLILAKSNYDFVHILNIGMKSVVPALLLFLMSLGRSKIILEMDEWKIGERRSVLSKFYFKLLFRIATGISKHVIVSSEYLHRIIQPYMSALSYIPYGVKVNSSIKPVRSKNQNNDLIMSYLGTYNNFEDFEVLIDNLERIFKEIPDLTIHFYGDGPMRTALQNQLKSEKVRFFGFIPEEKIDEVLSGSNAFFLPIKSTIKNIARCPNKINYYLIFNKPIITNKVGEVGKVLGEKGYYFEENNVNSLIRVISQARRKTVDYADIVNRYSWNNIVDQYHTIYDNYENRN